MNELVQYLLENLIVDFEGEVTAETVRGYLRQDESPEARALMQKVIEENGIDDLLLALADCLAANLASVLSTATVREHLITYSES